MKNIFIFCLLINTALLWPQLAQAQSTALIEARKLQVAKDYTRAAKILKNELLSNKKDGGVWFTYAQVQFARSQSSSITDLEDKKMIMHEAIEAYEKSLLYLDANTRPYAVARTELNEIYPRFIEEGVNYLNRGSYQEAIEKFQFAHLSAPEDTVSLIYGVNTAKRAERPIDAIYFYQELIEVNPKPNYYQSLYLTFNEELNDHEKALKVLEEAQKAYPSNYSFQKYEIDLLMANDQMDEVSALFNELSDRYSNNISFLLEKSQFLDQNLKKNRSVLDSARLESLRFDLIQTYEDIISISENHPLANFNLAVIYSEKSNEYIQTLNNMSAENYGIYSHEFIEKSTEALNMATEYMEAAKVSQPKNLNILNALKLFYDKLNKTEQRDAVIKEIEALKG